MINQVLVLRPGDGGLCPAACVPHYAAPLVTHRDPAFTDGLLSFPGVAAGLLIARRMVISASGMSYREFLMNVKRRLLTRG